MSGIVNEAGSQSSIISGMQSSFPSHASVPIAATTLGTSITTIELTSQSSSVNFPITPDITVNASDDTIAVANGGIYFWNFVMMITEADGSRENFVNGYIDNNAVPDGTSGTFFSAFFTNSASPAGVNYMTFSSSGIVKLVAADRILMKGKGEYSTQVVSVSATLNKSAFTLVRMQ